MKPIKKLNFAFFLFIILSVNFFMIISVAADGKLLRGEKWKRFSIKNQSADFFVSPRGNDRWSGKFPQPNPEKTDGPFATIGRARRAVQELKRVVFLKKDKPIDKRFIGSPHKLGKGKDILVLIRGGFYSLEEPLRFTPDDGGERVETNLPTGAFEYHKLKDYYVTYAAFPGEVPVISGGEPVKNWTRKGNIWTAEVNRETVSTLVAEGRKLPLARTPDRGYFIPSEFPQTAQKLPFREGDLRQWPSLEGNRVIFLLRWHTGINSLAMVDEKKHVATLKKPQPGILIVPPRYYVENIPELMDTPGEWFFDKNKKSLALIPPKNIRNTNQASVVLPVLKNLLIVQGDSARPVRNLRFYGLHLEALDPGGSAVSFEYANDCELVNSDLQSLAGSGVLVKKGCYHLKILSNTFQSIERGAITISGEAHPKNWADIIRETQVSFNRIDDCNGTNITAQNTLFTTISRNEITNNRGRFAISVGGWSNLEEAIDGGYRVEYNHLHQVQKNADDSGVIKTAGLTHDSIVRRNLIHDVKAGYFNDNVGFWFDNMSSGWTSEENIYYNLEQGEMKLCAANLVDNIYQNNFIIEPPGNQPEDIITEYPTFYFDQLKINDSSLAEIKTGDQVAVSTRVTNRGGSGILPVHFWVDGKIFSSKLFPVIRNNSRTIRFNLQFIRPGTHRITIGSAAEQIIRVTGKTLPVLFKNLRLSQPILPAGDSVIISADIGNPENFSETVTANLFLNNSIAQTGTVKLVPDSSIQVSFVLAPNAGKYLIRIGNSPEQQLEVYPHHLVDLKHSKFINYCSATASPFTINADPQKNFFRIKASGSDFFHAEDSYAAVYLKGIKGNFSATVKVTRFGKRTYEWFRAGLFVRNDLSKSFDIRPGSPGSVLLFTTPGRAGMDWDEFADGCMHKAVSENLPENYQFPLWLKLVRQGDSFSGYVSFDGRTWQREYHTSPIPQVAEAVDLGLAAGSGDKNSYWVEFEDFQLEIENAN